MKKFFFLSIFISLNCFGGEGHWNDSNDPSRLIPDYSTKFYELPLEGRVKGDLWSGDYWATYKGGITYRWMKKGTDLDKYGYDHPTLSSLTNPAEIKTLSPSEKLDLFNGDDSWSITRHERKRTEILKTVPGSSEYVEGHKIATWFGICHAWAPATLLFKNPSPAVVTSSNGVKIPLGSSDMKALYSYYLHLFGEKGRKDKFGNPLGSHSVSRFLGSRCNYDMKALFEKLDSGEINEEELKRELDARPKCDDTNAASFHIALTNMLGFKKNGFVMDYDRGSEVWNQAIESYKIELEPRIKNILKNDPTKLPNKIKVTNYVTWVSEIGSQWKKVKIKNRHGLRTSVYQYELELDENKNIIGGRWLTNKLKDRPDFLWMVNLPPLEAKLSGTGIEELLLSVKTKKRITRFKKPGDAKKFFKSKVLRMINAKRLIKGSKELAIERHSERRTYFRALDDRLEKSFLEKFFEMNKQKEKWFRKFHDQAGRIKSTIKGGRQGRNGCRVSGFNRFGEFAKLFNANADNWEAACDVAKNNCYNKLGGGSFCLVGYKEKYLKTCRVNLYNPGGGVAGTFINDGLIKKFACLAAHYDCQQKAQFKRKCKRVN